VPKDIPAKIRFNSATKSIKSQFTIAKGIENGGGKSLINKHATKTFAINFAHN